MTDRALPHHPAEYELADIYALKALQFGNASETQQKRALDWIITRACGTYDLSYRDQNPDGTTFAEGRRMVGLQIVKLLNINPEKLVKPKSSTTTPKKTRARKKE